MEREGESKKQSSKHQYNAVINKVRNASLGLGENDRLKHTSTWIVFVPSIVFNSCEQDWTENALSWRLDRWR